MAEYVRDAYDQNSVALNTTDSVLLGQQNDLQRSLTQFRRATLLRRNDIGSSYLQGYPFGPNHTPIAPTVSSYCHNPFDFVYLPSVYDDVESQSLRSQPRILHDTMLTFFSHPMQPRSTHASDYVMQQNSALPSFSQVTEVPTHSGTRRPLFLGHQHREHWNGSSPWTNSVPANRSNNMRCPCRRTNVFSRSGDILDTPAPLCLGRIACDIPEHNTWRSTPNRRRVRHRPSNGHYCIRCNRPMISPWRNPMMRDLVSDMLATRAAQIETERQTADEWFRRQSVHNLVGVDAELGQSVPQPIINQRPERLLHPEAALSRNPIPDSQLEDLQPAGASLAEIEQCGRAFRFLKDSNVRENEGERCTICLDDFETGHNVRSLRCDHMFHVKCIDRWLIRNMTCPICRLDPFMNRRGNSS